MTPASSIPHLLVSVRDAVEARRAVQGGADVIDFKDPDRGPLGRADFDVIAAAARELGRDFHDPHRRMSAALGEVTEGLRATRSGIGRLPHAVSFLKLGLSGLGRSTDWINQWLQVRSAFEQLADSPVQWVAVAYADAETAAAPEVEAVVEAAGQTGCAGVLIDTFDKSHSRLLDHLDPAYLRDVGIQVRDRQMFFALAGRLRISDVSLLSPIAPDVIAVRSAVCEGDNRQSVVSQTRVASLQQVLRENFCRHNSQSAGSILIPNQSASAGPLGG